MLEDGTRIRGAGCPTNPILYEFPAVPAVPDFRPLPHAISRRRVLALLSGTAALATVPAFAQNTTPGAIIQAALGEGQRFEPALVVEVARQIARRPYQAAASDLPDQFANLSYEQYSEIRALPQAQIWAGENRGFVVEPLHRGFVYTNPVVIYVAEDGLVRRIGYDRNRFEFGKLSVPANVPDIAFSGVKLLTTFGNGGSPVEFAAIQGANFFRAIARGQNFGVVARALTLRPAEARGEEFPYFRALWIERPTPGTEQLLVHAVLDSESVAGAVRLTLRPGDMTIVDVEMVLFPRVNLEHVGFGGMQASYLFGPNDRLEIDDARIGAYEAKGLCMSNGRGEWLWRPLQNPETLQISAFLDRSPKGFGLLQRDRDFAAFQDDEQRFELRPSLWVEPIGDWGEGVVQLIEIPSDKEINDNILSYWRPRGPIQAGSEVSVAYRQYWSWRPPERPPLALVSGTFSGRGTAGRRRRFMVDFRGDELGSELPDLRAVATASPGTIAGLKLYRYPGRKTIRAAFELDPGNENASEMRLVLHAGERPISETWLYRWTP